MGIDHFISIIDRAAIDDVLSLSWKEFNRRYGWKGFSQWATPGEFLMDFAYDPDTDPPIVDGVKQRRTPDQSTIDDIMERRTLRWTMNRCSPKLFFMYEIIGHVPDLRARCLEYTPRYWNDLAIVHAVGAGAFVRGDISQPTFFSVLRFCERLSLGDAINLKLARYRRVRHSLKSWVPSMPPFRWLSLDYFGEGYACLNVRETKAVVRFLQRAWKEEWPATGLSTWARGELDIPESVQVTVRNSEVSRQVLRWFRPSKRSGMCLVSYVDAL